MAYVTLEQAKDHCKVDEDITEDDIYITDLINVAESSVANEIGSTLLSKEVSGALPMPIIQSILLMVGHLYAIREPVLVGVSVVKCPYTLEYLLAPYKTWTCQ